MVQTAVEEISYIYRMYMSYPFAPQVPVEALGQVLIDQIYRRNRKKGRMKIQVTLEVVVSDWILNLVSVGEFISGAS